MGGRGVPLWWLQNKKKKSAQKQKNKCSKIKCQAVQREGGEEVPLCPQGTSNPKACS